MSLDMFLQVLWALKRFPTEIALVRLEWNVDSDVRSNMVALDGGGATTSPLARQVQIVGALATDVTLTDVFIEGFRSRTLLRAALPHAGQLVSLSGSTITGVIHGGGSSSGSSSGSSRSDRCGG